MPQWAWALTLQPTDKDGGSNPAAVPVSDVLGASCSYGKQGDALNYGGGSMTLALNNSTSKYTPQGGGTYTNAEFLGKVARLTANVTDSPSGAPASQLNLPGTTGSHAQATAYARQLTLPGSSGDFAQATFPSSANVTGDVDIRAQILTDWSSPASFGGIISKRGTGDTGEWLFQFDGSGNLRLTRFSDGAALDWTSTAAPNTVFSAHEVGWVRVTHDVDNGSSENVATFFTSTDGITYTQLGSTVTRSGTYTATTTSNPVTVGAARSNGNAAFSGEVHAAQVHDGIDGTQVVAFDPTLGLVGASSFTESTGETWSINGNAALSGVTGDLEVVARVKATDFTTGVIQTIVSTGSTAFEFNIGTTGKLMLRVNNVNKSSSETPPLDDGEIYWLRARRVRSTGAIEFFYAEDHPTEPTEWTSTGTASSTAGNITTATFATRVGLRAGASDSEANPFGGSIHAVVIRDGISGTDAVNFDPAQGAVGGTSFVAATRETWNLTGSASLSSPAPAWTHGAPAVFSGVVTDVNWSFDNRFESIMTLTVSDILTMLGTLSFAETDSGNGLDVASGAAATSITAVLAAANAVTSQITQTTVLNPSGDTGKTMQAVANFTGNAGELLQLIEQSDGGDLFARHGLPVDGTNTYNALTFRTRGQESISDAVTGVVDLVPLNIFDSTLTTSGLEPHEFQRIDFASGATASYSQVAFTREGGSVQKASVASANLNAFGARSLTRTGLLTNSDSDTLDLANAFLNQYGVGLVPPLAVRAIEMPPIVEGINNGYELVKFSIGDGCTVRFRPAGASATIVVAGVISGINWDITPGSSNMTVQLEDGDQTVFFILDSGEFGILDTNRLG